MQIETWELISYVVTAIGLPLAIVVFIYDKKKERDGGEDEVYQLLSDNYQEFLKIALEHPDLRLFSMGDTPPLSVEQTERTLIIFSMLVSLFERAYLLLHDSHMSPKQQRRWSSWEDYMREWCERRDFHASLPTLLQGEDAEFVAYIESVASGIIPALSFDIREITMASNSLHVIAHLRARPDRIAELRTMLTGLLAPTRKEPGCIRYELLASRQAPTDFTVIEEWTDEAALEAHFATNHMQDALGRLPDLLAGELDLRKYSFLG